MCIILLYSLLQKYLRQFHYISPLKNGNHDFRTALELFQEFMRLPVTGVLDEETIKEMNKPRCGFPDIEEDLETCKTFILIIGIVFSADGKKKENQ